MDTVKSRTGANSKLGAAFFTVVSLARNARVAFQIEPVGMMGRFGKPDPRRREDPAFAGFGRRIGHVKGAGRSVPGTRRGARRAFFSVTHVPGPNCYLSIQFGPSEIQAHIVRFSDA